MFPLNIPNWPQKSIQELLSISIIIFQLATQYYRQERFIVVPDIITLIRPTIALSTAYKRTEHNTRILQVEMCIITYMGTVANTASVVLSKHFISSSLI